MKLTLPPLRLTGAAVLKEGKVQSRSVGIDRGRFTKGPFPAVDLEDFIVLPGLINLHGPTCTPWSSVPPQSVADHLAQLDKEAAAQGVTTSWAPLAWGQGAQDRDPILTDWQAATLATHCARRDTAWTDLRLQLRVSPLDHKGAAAFLAAIKRYEIDALIFDGGCAFDQITRGVIARHLCGVAEACDALGVLYGSSADATAEVREHYAMIGAGICEFPQNHAPAAAARAMGDAVILDADAVLEAADGQRDSSMLRHALSGTRCAIASPGGGQRLIAAAFGLVERRLMSLPKAWALVSRAPAEIMRLPDRGHIDLGRRADLVVLERKTLAVGAVISAGRLVHLAGDARNRFQALGLLPAMQMPTPAKDGTATTPQGHIAP